MATLLAETTDIQVAAEEEQRLPPGVYEVRLSLLSPVSQEQLDDLHAYLLEQGVDIKGFLQQRVKGLYQIRIKYQKHAPSEAIAQWALALIPMIPTFLIASLVGIGIFRVESIMRNILPIVLAVGGFTIITVAMIRKPLGVAVGKYAERKL